MAARPSARPSRLLPLPPGRPPRRLPRSSRRRRATPPTCSWGWRPFVADRRPRVRHRAHDRAGVGFLRVHAHWSGRAQGRAGSGPTGSFDPGAAPGGMGGLGDRTMTLTGTVASIDGTTMTLTTQGARRSRSACPTRPTTPRPPQPLRTSRRDRACRSPWPGSAAACGRTPAPHRGQRGAGGGLPVRNGRDDRLELSPGGGPRCSVQVTAAPHRHPKPDWPLSYDRKVVPARMAIPTVINAH